MRQLEHERGGIDRLLSNHALYLDARAATPTRATRWCARRSAALETGYRIGRLLVLREVLGQAPPSFSAATKTFCTEHEQRVADVRRARRRAPRRCCGTQVARGVVLRPGVHDHGRHLERAAQHHRRAGARASRGNPEHPPRGVAEVDSRVRL